MDDQARENAAETAKLRADIEKTNREQAETNEKMRYV